MMQLTFGNMILELNIFHLCKGYLAQDEDEQEEMCLIHDATHGSLALKAYQQNLYLKYYY